MPDDKAADQTADDDKTKVKSPQADEKSNNDQKDEFGKNIKQSELNPKTAKALGDLLGKANEEHDKLKQVKVYSPFRVYYDSEASSVSAVNGTGPFDILPGHKNFLSLLSPGDIVVRSVSGKEESVTIDRGVMHVSNDIVKVFLDV